MKKWISFSYTNLVFSCEGILVFVLDVTENLSDLKPRVALRIWTRDFATTASFLMIQDGRFCVKNVASVMIIFTVYLQKPKSNLFRERMTYWKCRLIHIMEGESWKDMNNFVQRNMNMNQIMVCVILSTQNLCYVHFCDFLKFIVPYHFFNLYVSVRWIWVIAVSFGTFFPCFLLSYQCP